ncbi:hypothetical protein [Streptomyces sp. NPDC001980]|uniref:hypothetical protein n=1 Tax=Streptomyces sp. NPDC001980 TaxID=3157126 RepID=UPI0033267BEC
MSSHRNGFDRGTVTVPAGEPARYDREPALYGTESPDTAGNAASVPTGRGPARA